MSYKFGLAHSAAFCDSPSVDSTFPHTLYDKGKLGTGSHAGLPTCLYGAIHPVSPAMTLVFP